MATAAPPGMSALSLEGRSIPPNQSLYIQNLPEKLQKEDVRRELYILFSTYGPVIDVTALKNNKMRGQAHILFKDVQGATQAMRACQGFDFFGRQMKISYSKNRSNAIAKLTGTFNQPTSTEQPKQLGHPASSFPPPPGTGPSVNAPPSTLPAPPSGLPPPPGLPAKRAPVNGNAAALKPPPSVPQDVASPQGTKRSREESDDEEASMEEDDDDDEGEMDMSDDDE